SRPPTLRTGDAIDPDDLLQGLSSSGYEASSLVEEVGTFARRGGILDVFPIGASHPVRIELFGDTVESLRLFDPVTQRSLDRIESVAVPPLQQADECARLAVVEELEALPVKTLEVTALTRWQEDLEHLRSGEPAATQLFSPYLNGDATLLDAAMPSGPHAKLLVVLEDPDDIRFAAGDLGAKAEEIRVELEGSGQIPGDLKPGLLAFASVERGMLGAAVLEFARGGDEQAVENRIFSRPTAFGGRVRDFVHALEPFPHVEVAPSQIETVTTHDPRNALIVTSYQHARLAEMLEAEGIPISVVDDILAIPEPGSITIVRGSLAEGWVAPDLGFELFTDHEVFGWSKPRTTPRRKRAARETFFTEFIAGDYVVHIEHGIGRLVGTTRMMDAEIERDYLIVEYAGTDKLYVPTDQLDRVTRYIGMGEAKPQLNKLGGQEWTRAKAKAKQAAEDMAEELIVLYAQREAAGGHAFMPDTPWQRELEGSFPFEETADQMQAIMDVKTDMEQERPMDRLVVADVGYGKTEVAVRAAFKAVIDGFQVAVLVPTTVLGQQHLETFRERLDAFPVRIDMLSRFRTPKEQKETLRRLQEGEVDVVIGTHRLLGKDVLFNNLGLLVVDEEQRFGVRHKERLKQLRAAVDVLTLTATPIPRTLHMSLTGIRDVSIIQTPPEGRLPIRTHLQPYEDRLVREAIVRELEREGQVYFVHNRVSGIEAVAQKLRRLVPEARVLVGHGQMPEDQLENVMLAFSHQEADVLLCSTIIESGLDIPNVNTIVIDHAEALGLAQLYQLRGRVGRSVNQAYAYLLYPRDARVGKEAMSRMEAVFEATELGAGFRIAMADLEIRGAGNLLGSEQSGHVAAIGFDLYTNLLKDAVDRMREQVPAEAARTPVTVDLPFDVLIPDAYVPDERERLALYRRLAGLSKAEDVAGLEEELRDRFGPIPGAVRNLLTQLGVKFLAETAHVTAVALRGDRLTIRGERRILYDRVALYKRFGTNARIDENVLRVEASTLEPDWLEAIRGILADTAALRERQAAAVAAV
ncbi:MAG TPA: transcription-repair coupling factor, partial [Chloroflexota bacterium]|nr:transcription-repair coupling factor [Chloroflexota bacterium]